MGPFVMPESIFLRTDLILEYLQLNGLFDVPWGGIAGAHDSQFTVVDRTTVQFQFRPVSGQRREQNHNTAFANEFYCLFLSFRRRCGNDGHICTKVLSVSHDALGQVLLGRIN